MNKQTTETTRKLTTLETRAVAFCEAIRTNGGKFHFAVIWKPSRTWGSIPSIAYRGEKCAEASGCGYDKLSAVLVDALRFLLEPGTVQHSKFWQLAGAGVSTVQAELLTLGYKLTHVYDGKAEDGFTIEEVAI